MITGLALLGPSTLQALDVSEYGVLKGKRYSQTEATTPADPAFSAFWLSAYARLTAANSITEATVQTPGNAVLPLFAVDDPLLMKLEIPGGLTMADLNSALPNGTYYAEPVLAALGLQG